MAGQAAGTGVYDVVVVGAGPVGLTVAALLVARGLDVLIAERRPGPSNAPKAISLDDESLRTYQQAGIVDRVLQVVVPGTGTAYYDAEGALLFHGRAAVPHRHGYPFKNPFAQPDLESALTAAIRADPRAELAFDTSVTALEQDDDGVSVRLTTPSGPGTARCAYVLGADGGRSTVRALTGTTMTGRSFDEAWLVVDTLGDTRTERYGMHHGDPRRPHVIVPGLHGRCRYEFLLDHDEHPGDGTAPFALVRDLLAPHRAITGEQVERATTYTFHSLIADRWRTGRAFLLGDAAHMMPPFAGQGLNSGIRDAANLAWKLAHAVRAHGRGVDELLDSYELERRPHASAVVASSEKLGRIVMTRSERLARRRDELVRKALSTPEGRSFFEQMRYRPPAVHTRGMVLDAGSHPLVGTQIGQPTVFSYPEHRQVGLDVVTGDGWSVLGVGVPVDAWGPVLDEVAGAREWTCVDVPLDDEVHDTPRGVGVAIDLDTRLYAELGGARGHFVLLRPDRFVAAVTAPEQVVAALGALAARLGGPVAVPA